MKLVFVHGFLGNAHNWLPVLQKLRPKILSGELPAFEVLSVDLLGHGKKSSLSESEELSLENIANDLALEIGDTPFVAVGHSFGLRPLLVLSRKPEFSKQLKTLIVEDSSPLISEQGYEDLKKIFEQVELPKATRQLARDSIEKVFSKDSKMSRFLMTNVHELKSGLYGWRFSAKKLNALLEESRETELWQEWESFPGPIEMIIGEKSGFVSTERIAECVSRRPHYKTGIHIIPEAGHWVHSDQLDAFVSCLSSLLKLI